ncbi:MAG: NHL domain-containing protein [Syntrophales bacterium]
MAKLRKEKGFILVILLALLLLLAVTAMSLNFKAGMQGRMAANRTVDAQTYLDQLAVIEQSVWKLTGDPSWRTVAAGEDYLYQGRTYNRKVFSPDTATYAALIDYKDAIIVSVTAPYASRPVNKSFRYNISTPLLPPVTKPRQTCADSAGNIFFADYDNHSISKIDAATQAILPVAGTGKSGFSGDGGPATQAQLNSPSGVAVDTSGNIYIADTGNNRIRKFTVGGNIITAAGTGSATVPAGYPVDNILAVNTTLNSPSGVAVDGANIYIADTGNNRIRKVAADTGIITSFAGTGTAGYGGDGGTATTALIDGPTGICVKTTGEAIIADTNNSCLRQVGITKSISTLPMTVGPGLNSPDGVASYYDAVQKKLFIYIADSANHRIRKLDTATNALVTVAGTGSATVPAGYPVDNILAVNTTLNSPTGVAVDTSGNLYIADTANHKIRQVTAIGGVITDSSCSSNCSIISTVAGTGVAGYSGDAGDATAAQLNGPQGVSIDTKGDIFIADTNNHRIRKIKNYKISTVAGTGEPGYSGDGGICAAAQLDTPKGIFINMVNDLYIADTGNNRIRKILNTNSIISTVAGISGSYSGSYPPLGDGGPTTQAQLNSPSGVAVDASGNIYIADTGNHALRMVNHASIPIITTMAGAGAGGYNGDSQPAVQAMLNSPTGVALGMTKAGGRIYIGDTKNNRVRMLFLKTEPQVYGP